MADETKKATQISEGGKGEAGEAKPESSGKTPLQNVETGQSQTPSSQEKPGTAGSGGQGTQAEALSFSNLKEEKITPAPGNMDFILDLPLVISVQLGTSKILIKDLLQLGQGSIIELEKLAGEPMEVLVNGKLVAMGEVVVVNEKFGVRLTDIMSPDDRVKQLK